MTSLVLPPRQVNRMGPAYFDGDRVVILSATKPTVRPAEVGGGALVAGDIWVDTTTGERWRFNGTVFVNAVLEQFRGLVFNATPASQNVGGFPVPKDTQILLVSEFYLVNLSVNDGSNYFSSIKLCSSSTFNYTGGVSTIGLSTATRHVLSNTLNEVVTVNQADVFSNSTAVGSPTMSRWYGCINYRRIAP